MTAPKTRACSSASSAQPILAGSPPRKSQSSTGAFGRPSSHADTEPAHRDALRAELFGELFLPPPGEIADPALLSLLSVPIDLARWLSPDPERRRILLVRLRVARFRAVNHQQRQLRSLVLEMLDYMARELLGPGDEAALEEWWAAACAYRKVLELPVMATPRARGLLPKIVDAPWPEVEKKAASLARRYR